MLSPPHHHMLTPTGYPTALSCTQYPSNVEHDISHLQHALDKWHHFLEGVMEKFEILMDHQNLAYFHNAQKLNHQQACWSLFLSCFNFSLHHQPGQLMGRPNMLSQRSDHP